jgi:hypothetical protein
MSVGKVLPNAEELIGLVKWVDFPNAARPQIVK